jgi:hypothetical protein
VSVRAELAAENLVAVMVDMPAGKPISSPTEGDCGCHGQVAPTPARGRYAPPPSGPFNRWDALGGLSYGL